MILRAADGATDKEISAELGVLRATVARWRGRYIEDGLSGIEQDGTRPGRKPQISERKVKAIVKMTTQPQPVPDLIDSIGQFLAKHNMAPKPYIWTAKATDILAKVTRARAKLNKLQSV